ncbi:MAG: SDR family oxidoreductase [Aggregatilineales bacterium]
MTQISLAGRTALITGASRSIGIGAATARALAEAGANIFTTYYRPVDVELNLEVDTHDAENLIDELRGMGVQANGLEVDLADPSAAHDLMKRVNEQVGLVDILVNNATYSLDVDINALTAEILDRHYEVNVRGMMLLSQAFVQQWNKPSGGRIINMTSGQGLHGMPDNLAYAVTKASVDVFTVSLSEAVMSRGITVNTVEPGATDTGWMSAELKAHIISRSPTGRVGMPEDAARLIRFLVSDEAQWITGQLIRSRGGM